MKFRKIQPRGSTVEIKKNEHSFGNCNALRIWRHLCARLAVQPPRLPARNGYIISEVAGSEWLCNLGGFRCGIAMQPLRLTGKNGYRTLEVVAGPLTSGVGVGGKSAISNRICLPSLLHSWCQVHGGRPAAEARFRRWTTTTQNRPCDTTLRTLGVKSLGSSRCGS